MVVFRFTDLTTLIPADQIPVLEEQVAVYWSLPWYDTLLGALERSFTIVFHIAASLLVLQVFIRGQKRWLLFAILWHAAADAGAVYLVQVVNPYAAEIWVGVVCLISLLMIYLLRYNSVNEKDEDDPKFELEITNDLP